MIFSNFAFEVGGVFLFVAGLMYLTLSGRLGNLFRDRAPKPPFLIALTIGFAVYHWAPMFRFSAPELAAPERRTPIPGPPPPPEPPRPTKHASKPMVKAAAAPENARIVIMEVVPATQVFVPQASEPAISIPASPASDPYESKAKRSIKAVGRFLHLQKKAQR
jgi:hypothetical protein